MPVRLIISMGARICGFDVHARIHCYGFMHVYASVRLRPPLVRVFESVLVSERVSQSVHARAVRVCALCGSVHECGLCVCPMHTFPSVCKHVRGCVRLCLIVLADASAQNTARASQCG